MATEQQLMQALRNADAAGDTAAAKRFAQLIQERRGAAAQPQLSKEQQIAQDIETGKVQPAAALERSGGSGLLGNTGSFTRDALGQEQRPTRNELAAQGGVDIESGAPTMTRLGASTSAGRGLFTNDPTIRERNVAKLLAESFGQDVPVRTGPVSESLEFQNPETGQWTLVDEEGISGRDFADLAGDAAVLGGELAGAAGGGLAGSVVGPAGTTVGAVGGAGLGAAAGEAARQYLGRALFGTNEGVTAADTAAEAAEVGAITSLLGPLLTGGARAVRNVKSRFTGQTPDREVATLIADPQNAERLRQGLRETVEANQRLAEQRGDTQAAETIARLRSQLEAADYDFRALTKQEADQLWANSQYKPTVADITGDKDLETTQTRLMRGGASTARPLRQQREAGWSVLREGFDNASDVPPEAVNKAELSRNISDTVTDRLNRQLADLAGRTQSQVQATEARGAQRVSQANERGRQLIDLARERTESAGEGVAGLRQSLPENPQVDQRALGRDVRENVLVPERDRRLGAAREQYANLETPDVEVRPERLRGAMSSAQNQAQRGALPSQQSGTLATTKEILDNIEEAAPDGQSAIIKNLSGEDALRTMSQLKDRARSIDRGELTNADSAVVKRAISALDDDIRAAFPDDYTAAKAAVDAEYRQMQDELERSLIGRITQQKGGKYVVNDEFVFDRMIQRGNKTDADTFRTMMENPEYGGSRVALRDAFADRYNRAMGATKPGDAAYQRKHDQFMRDYGSWMDGVFSPAEMSDIRKVGSAANRLRRISQRQRQVEQKVSDILSSIESGVRASTRQSVQGIEQRGRQQAADATSQARNLIGSTGQGGAVNPDAVFDRIWGNKAGMSRLRQLKGALEDAPVLWEQFKARAHHDLGEKVFQAAKDPNASALNDFLQNNDSYLREAFGDQYVQDLRIVGNALRRTTGKATADEGNDPGRELVRNFSRVFFAPPLSARGRAQTAVERFIGSNQREQMSQLLADPANLHKLVNMNPLGDRTRLETIRDVVTRGVAAYGGLGYSTESED